MKKRFRGFLPTVVDVETGGINPQKDALLEIAAIPITRNDEGLFIPGQTISCHIEPFPKANLDPEALKLNKIDPYHPFRMAKPEKQALASIFEPLADIVQHYQCQRAVLVGHNAWFDLLFLKAAVKRTGLKSPFHAFTTFDTATLGGLVYGQTVLAKALKAAGLRYDKEQAHSAIYDAEITAELFCKIINDWPFPQTSPCTRETPKE